MKSISKPFIACATLISLAATSSIAAVAQDLSVAAPQAQSLPAPVAQPVEVAPYAVIERGPHHTRVAHVLALTNGLGKVLYRTNGYTIIGTGLNHLVGNEYVESQENIEVTANGAQATNAAHQVFFWGNANAQAAVQLITPDGKQLSSHVVSLSYFCPATGASALLAQLQDSIGQLVSPNEVIYTNAFGGTNGCIADIYYRFSKAGLEQNIILRSQPPAPEAFNINSADGVLLQVISEFVDSATPAIVTNTTDLAQGVLNEVLDFGAMQIGRGKAFLIGDNPPDTGAQDVYKQWVVANGHSYLIEQVPLTPATIAASTSRGVGQNY